MSNDKHCFYMYPNDSSGESYIPKWRIDDEPNGDTLLYDTLAEKDTPGYDIPYVLIKCVNYECPNFEIFWGDAVQTGLLWTDMGQENEFWTEFFKAGSNPVSRFKCKQCVHWLSVDYRTRK